MEQTVFGEETRHEMYLCSVLLLNNLKHKLEILLQVSVPSTTPLHIFVESNLLKSFFRLISTMKFSYQPACGGLSNPWWTTHLQTASHWEVTRDHFEPPNLQPRLRYQPRRPLPQLRTTACRKAMFFHSVA